MLFRSHVPYSLQTLGTILNTGPRPGSLQDVDPSKVSLWSTIPLNAIPTTGHLALFSIITFSHLNHQFYLFCSGESCMSSDPPTKTEEAHVKRVLEHLRDMANEARPTYDSTLVAAGGSMPRHRSATDPPMIIIGGVHAKWRDVLAPMSASQYPNVRYAFPRGGALAAHAASRRIGEDDIDWDMSSEIGTSDLSFVRGASSIPRSNAYFLSRARYSVCIRSQVEGGRPVACALMHSDGRIGGLHVDPRYQRRGLGSLVIRALMEKLDFGNSQDGAELHLDDHHQDLGGGALGWNWTDVAADNNAGNQFFTSLVGKDGRWISHWTYMFLEPNGRSLCN